MSDLSIRRRLPFATALAVVSVIGGLWRLGYLVVAKWNTDLMLNDSLYFSLQAALNSEGKWFQEGLTGEPGAEHGPLTSLYLTPWSLGGWDVSQQRLGITLLGIATVPVIGLLARRVGGPTVGLVAAGIAAVYPNLWLNDSLVMSETIAVLLVSSGLLLALRTQESPTLRRAAGLGVLVGLAALTRSELALLAPLFAGLLWWRLRRTDDVMADEAGDADGPAVTAAVPMSARSWLPAVLLATSLLTVSPWIGYNLGRFERPVLMSTNDGTTLLGANCDSTYYGDIGGWDIHCLAPVPQESQLDASSRSHERRRYAVAYIRAHLDRVPVVVAARVGRLLDLYAVPAQVGMDTREEKARWASWTGVVMFWLLAVVAVVGWLDLRRHGRRERWWLLAVPVCTLVTAVAFYAFHRIRAPAEPVIIVLAAVGVVALARRRGSVDDVPSADDPVRDRRTDAAPSGA